MINIYLVRHATYDESRNIMPGRLPVPLSEKGFKEAEKLRMYFKDKNIQKIYSSAVLRCQQTAETIADNKIPIEYDQRLLETFSAYQGYWIKDWREYWGHRRELGGEDNHIVMDRVVDFLDDVNFDDEKNYIICSHGDPLYFIYQHLDQQEMISDLELDIPIPDYPSYQPKGSIRQILINKNKELVEVKALLTQEDLN